MKNIIQKVTTGGVLIQNNKVLILQRAANDKVFPGLWELPSGKKEPLESVWDSVVREVKEETNVSVKTASLVFAFNYAVERPEATYDATQLIFLVKPKGSTEVTISDEHDNFKWIKESEIKDYNITKETCEAILKAFSVSKAG